MADKSVKSAKILIVEDDGPIANALRLKLEAENFIPTVAVDGKEALALVEKEKFDLILLDIMMPGMNGFEVMEEFKKMNVKTRVIILSNLSQEEDIEKAKKAGAADYFVKSENDLADIVKYIEKALGK